MPSLNSLYDKISTRVKPGDTVILGLSGGADSVFLFHQLLRCPKQPKIIACHVNYHLREKDSDLDEKFVSTLCSKHNVPLEILHADSSIKKGNLENNCRNLRYQFLEKIRQKHRAPLIMVAHQLDDQIETFFLNLLRGSSFRGFGGMREYDAERKLFRPLLDWSKKELISWMKTNRQKFRTDLSNFSDQFSRNKIRLKILPEFIKLNPNFLVTAGESLRELGQHLDMIAQTADKWLKTNLKFTPLTKQGLDQIGTFDLQIFNQETPAFQKILLNKIHQKLHQKSLTRQTLTEILKTLHKNRTGLKKEFGPGTFLKVINCALPQSGKCAPPPPFQKTKREVVIERKLN